MQISKNHKISAAYTQSKWCMPMHFFNVFDFIRMNVFNEKIVGIRRQFPSPLKCILDCYFNSDTTFKLFFILTRKVHLQSLGEKYGRSWFSMIISRNRGRKTFLFFFYAIVVVESNSCFKHLLWHVLFKILLIGICRTKVTTSMH